MVIIGINQIKNINIKLNTLNLIKERLKTSKMQETLRTNTYKDIKDYDWKSIPDFKDNDFEPFIARIMKSNQSYFITGPGGSGKTTL